MLISKLKSSYSIAIIDSGPAGLSVAYDLVTRYKAKNILVIEPGDLEYNQIVAQSPISAPALPAGIEKTVTATGRKTKNPENQRVLHYGLAK